MKLKEVIEIILTVLFLYFLAVIMLTAP